MHSSLVKSLIVAAFAFGTTAVTQTASADPASSVRWETVVGILQPNNVVGSGTGAATGGGAPWSTIDGHVAVRLDKGRVDFDVSGLVLAGGNAIGTPGPVAQVKGTLVCDTDGSASGGNSVLVDTPLVDLDDNGDATFSGNLGHLPAVCSSEDDIAFLIRTGSGRWIANGAVIH